MSPRWAETVPVPPFSEPPALGACLAQRRPLQYLLNEWCWGSGKEMSIRGQALGKADLPFSALRHLGLVIHCLRWKYQGSQVLVFLLYRRRGGVLEGLDDSQWHPANGCGTRGLDQVCPTLLSSWSQFCVPVYQAWVCISFRWRQ